ncbi:MAG: Gfo/Idh/MocA family oxidoreductase, partial [Verrucomicrobia bacterium]|nr:Gfo/Idh/MocA family oxidoreductase [Verrucomicrobiota bacterium]
MNQDIRLRWGLIGASNIAKTYMIDAINAQPDSQVVAVLSSNAERAKSYADENGIGRSYNSLEAFLADPEIDVVYISTTNELHKAQTIAAAKAGKHVHCEKPLALTVADAQEMLAACKQAGVTLGTNHHLRSTTILRKLHELVRCGDLGDVLAARAFFAVYLPLESQGWRTAKAETGAGVVLDITVHVADALRFVLGDEVEEVVAATARQGIAEGEIEDTVMGVLRFRNGTMAQFHDSFTVPHALTGFELHGSKCSVYAEDCLTQVPKGSVHILRNGKRQEVDLGPIENHYEHLVRAFNR